AGADLSGVRLRPAAPAADPLGSRLPPLPHADAAGRDAMTLRSKLTLMFFGALQVTFLTAVGTFWAVQSWQLLTDDLTLIHDQNLRLEHALETPTAGTPGHGGAYVRSLLKHAQTLAE